MAIYTTYASSSNMNVNFLLSTFLPLVENPDGVIVIDLFNDNMRKAINAIQITNSDTYISGQKLPCIAYAKTGNTSSYWMLAIASGVLHPYKMNGGDMVLTPNINTMRQATSIGATSNVQKTISTVKI